MKKFKIYDLYEGVDCIGHADTWKEVRKIARQQYEETDGECMICYVKLDPVTQKYSHKKYRFIVKV